MTKEFILKLVIHTVQKQGGRALEGCRCVYKTKDNKLCGHSMFIKPKFRPNKPMSATKLITMHGDYIHYEEFQGFPIQFWIELQIFHDACINWKKDLTLTKIGKRDYNRIINTNYQ